MEGRREERGVELDGSELGELSGDQTDYLIPRGGSQDGGGKCYEDVVPRV